MLKRVSVLLVAMFLQVFFVNSAMADDTEGKKAEKPKKDYKWAYFAALPVYNFTGEILLHEGSHAAAIWLYPNYSVRNFKPWPHYVNGGEHFVLGSVDSACFKDCSKKSLVVISLAPYITTPAIFTLSDILLSTRVVKPTSVGGRILYFAGMVMPWWDFAYEAVWTPEMSDATYIAKNLEVSRWKVKAVGISVSAVGIWRLWNGYKRAFPKHRSKTKESNLVVLPMTDRETLGLSVRMRF